MSLPTVSEVDVNRKPADVCEACEIIGALKVQLNQAKRLAGALQFVLILRARVEEFETQIGSPYIVNDQEYEQWVIISFGNHAQELRQGYHYRRWVRILHCGNPNDSLQLHKILSTLNGHSYVDSRNNIHNFAVGMHKIYKIFSNDIHSPLLLSPFNFINSEDVPQYIALLPKELQDAADLFYRSGN